MEVFGTPEYGSPPACEAAHLGRAIRAALASVGGRAGRETEAGELPDRSRHLFSDYELRRRRWEVGLVS